MSPTTQPSTPNAQPGETAETRAPRITLAQAQTNLKKVYTPKDAKGFTAGREFKVIEVLEYDFKGQGRNVPAYRFQRVDAPQSITLLSAQKFHQRFNEVPQSK